MGEEEGGEGGENSVMMKKKLKGQPWRKKKTEKKINERDEGKQRGEKRRQRKQSLWAQV